MLCLLNGSREATEARKKAIADKRKDRLRYIMLESKDPQKVIHAAVRWYGLRNKWETDSQAEFVLYNSMLLLLAQEYSPEWIWREFPPSKTYDGARYEIKDYFTSRRALENAAPFAGDSEAVNLFLWEYDNDLLRDFVMAGLFLVDELRAAQGEPSLMKSWADEVGITVYHSTKTEGGKEILLDDEGRSLGVMKRKRPRYIGRVK